MASNPMQQFSVHKIGPEIKISGIDLSFTNASLFMFISASMILLFLFFGTKEKKIVPDKIQLVTEMFYTFVAKMISDTAGSKAKPYFPAAVPKKKKVIINQGLVSNQLSKINPIIVPTATAATSSVPNLKALPINEPFFSLSD